MEDSAKGFSDFGGGVEGNETLLQTAYREGSEELSGFLGNESDLQILVKKNGGFYEIHHKEHNYHIHIFFLEYNEELPRYFTNHHQFVWKRMNKDLLNDSKLFEKQEIRWFSAKQLKNKKGEFRSFYQSIVDQLISELPNISTFIMKKSRKRGTRKLKGGS
jgi:8-oxo-dGTP pyrophosphatase MutT (NUDIX family)